MWPSASRYELPSLDRTPEQVLARRPPDLAERRSTVLRDRRGAGATWEAVPLPLLGGYVHHRVPNGAERVDGEDVEPVRTGGAGTRASR